MPDIFETREATILDPSGAKIRVSLYDPFGIDRFIVRFSGYRVSIRGEQKKTRVDKRISTDYIRALINEIEEILDTQAFSDALNPDVANRNFTFSIDIWEPLIIGFELDQFYIGFRSTVGIRKLRIEDPIHTLNEFKLLLEVLKENPERI